MLKGEGKQRATKMLINLILKLILSKCGKSRRDRSLLKFPFQWRVGWRVIPLQGSMVSVTHTGCLNRRPNK